MVAKAGRGRLVGGFLLLTAIWGTTWAAIRVGLQGVPPFTGVALRFAIAGTLLLALAPALGVRLGRLPHEKALWVANGILSFCLSYSVVYWSEQYLPSGLAAVLFATCPLFVAVLAHFLLRRERLAPLAVVGLVLGFAGVAVIFSDDLALLGGESVRHAALVMLVSPLVSAVLLYLAVLGSAVTFTVYYWLLARVAATRVALVSYLIPIVAVAVGAVLFDEPLRPRLLAGSALILAGVAIVTRRR